MPTQEQYSKELLQYLETTAEMHRMTDLKSHSFHLVLVGMFVCNHTTKSLDKLHIS